MRLQIGIFTRIFLAFAGLALVPLLISAALISSVYQEMTDRLLTEIQRSSSPAVITQAMKQVSGVHQDTYLLLFFFLLISVVLVIFAALFLSRTFAGPLTSLLKATEYMAKGELDVRLKVDRDDEFGALAESFNVMARQLDEARKRLEQQNLQLEQHVAERTAELTMVNVELRESAEQVREANRLKSEFLANMSHELRTPLSAILGYTDLLLDGIYGEMEVQQHDSLKKVRSNSEALLRLINDILDLSRIEAGRMSVTIETFNPGDLVANAVASVRPLFDKKGLVLRAEVSRNLPQLEADRGKVQQVLYNLLSNALKYTGDGGATVRVYTAMDRGRVWFELADTGDGIEDGKLEEIFDQFRQIDGSTTRKKGGTGLGLALCKKLVNLLGGELEVESEIGKGSVFRFSIPVKAIRREDKLSEPRRSPRPGKKPVVLAIDDDEEILDLLSDSLEPAGYRVVRCRDADTGVRQVREINPYAVTLDIMMPIRDGWSVLQELKSDPETACVPVVIVSIIDDKERGFNMGVDDYMVKPINRSALIARLDSFGNYRRTEELGPEKGEEN